jgi:hypothetical protein
MRYRKGEGEEGRLSYARTASTGRRALLYGALTSMCGRHRFARFMAERILEMNGRKLTNVGHLPSIVGVRRTF